MQNKKMIITAIIAVIIVGGGAFYGGTVYEKNKLAKQASSRSGDMAGANVQRRPGGIGGFAGMRENADREKGGFVSGDILSKDEKSITVKIPDGGSKIVFFSDSTAIGKSVSGSMNDLASGQQVMASGKTNSDGTITADNIQIRPSGN